MRAGSGKTWSAFDVVASLFVVAVGAHAASLMVLGVPGGYERLAILWLLVQIGALGLVAYFWSDRGSGSRQALHAAAVGDMLLLAMGLVFPRALEWAARAVQVQPGTLF